MQPVLHGEVLQLSPALYALSRQVRDEVERARAAWHAIGARPGKRGAYSRCHEANNLAFATVSEDAARRHAQHICLPVQGFSRTRHYA